MQNMVNELTEGQYKVLWFDRSIPRKAKDKHTEIFSHALPWATGLELFIATVHNAE